MDVPKTPRAWIKRFARAAEQRYTTAEFLHRHRYFVDQIYLTGYVVECALKALILHDTPISQRQEKLATITRGTSSHDFDYLKAQYPTPGRFPKEGVTLLRLIVGYKWTTSMRYDVGSGDAEIAKDFLDSAKTFLDWVHRRLE